MSTHYVFRIRPFVRSDIVIVISHGRLKQFCWNWPGIFASPYWWPD